MPEVRSGLESNDVTVRTEAVRSLAASAAWSDFPTLVRMARTDKSPSVRLYAAAGASDLAISSERTPEEQSAILDAIRTFDPGDNPSLLLVLAGVPTRAGVDRLGRMLRDPRSDVRMAAATATRRMANRPDVGTLVNDAVRGWLAEGRHPPDALAELVRLAGELGWTDTEDAIRAAAAKGRAPAEAAELALQWLAARQDPTSWDGVWMSTDEDQPVVWLFVESGEVWGAEGSLGALRVKDGVGTVAGRGPLRRRFETRTSIEGTQEAVTCDGRVMWRHVGPALARVVDELGATLRDLAPVARGLAAQMKDLEGLGAMRSRVVALWMSGQLAEAERVCASLLAGEKKPNPQVLWLKANVMAAQGDFDAARSCVRQALETGPKKAPWRADAELLLRSLHAG